MKDNGRMKRLSQSYKWQWIDRLKVILLSVMVGYASLSASCKKESPKPVPEKPAIEFVNTYTNPLAPGADPWVIRAGNAYYACGSLNDHIWIKSSDRLSDLYVSPDVYDYYGPDTATYFKEVWAPELHYVSGRWYIYYAADNGINANHRIYALRGGNDESNPVGSSYEYVGQIKTLPVNNWAIDATVFSNNNQLYMVWSGWPGTVNVVQNLYIAKMSDPVTVSSDRVSISSPEKTWETVGDPKVNEGPEVLEKNGLVHVVYSASGSWTDNYCLGMLTCTDGNFLNASSWVKGNDPVFSSANDVYAPGHASFVTSTDGNQDWIVYHSARAQGSGWDRMVRIQQYTWNGNDPYFGEPIPSSVNMSVPSTGQQITPGEYRITSRANDLCLEESPLGDVTQNITSSAESQKWDVTLSTNGSYQISSKSTGKNLIPFNGSISKGASVVVSNQVLDNAGNWRIEKISADYYRIINRKSLLGLQASGTQEGTGVIQATPRNLDSQYWKFSK